MSETYNPYWSENVIFWGAGATYSLGMKTTGAISDSITKLTGLEQPIDERINAAFGEVGASVKQGIRDLIFLIDHDKEILAYFIKKGFEDEEIYQIIEQEYDRIYERNNIKDFQAMHLRETYDWETLTQVVSVCPGAGTDSFQLQDLFNIIDMHIQGGQGFRGENHSFISISQLLRAKNTLKMLLILLHSIDYMKALDNEKVFEPYKGFVNVLAEMMLEEGQTYKEQGKELNKRDFYLFNYAIISMNWDPILLWLLFMAHKQVNESKNNKFEETNDGKFVPLKLFHDLGHFMAVRSIGKDSLGMWYPMNETVVQRLNDPEHDIATRRVRIGKFYFPHGMHGFRECPNCGKLTAYLGDSWDWFSKTLFPAGLISGLNLPSFNFKSVDESLAHLSGKFDAIQCVYCGEMTEIHHTPLVMQSSFKGNHPPFIEEIQRDMRVSLEKAEHIILMGYSLPQDDFIYRSMLSARKNRKGKAEPKCSVIVDALAEAQDEWLTDEKLDRFIKKNPNTDFSRVIQTARDIFGRDNVRGYAAGIPNVFTGSNKETVKNKVRKIFNY